MLAVRFNPAPSLVEAFFEAGADPQRANDAGQREHLLKVLLTRPHPQPQALRTGAKNFPVMALPCGVQEHRIDAQSHAFFGCRNADVQPLCTALVHDVAREVEEGGLAADRKSVV